MYNIIYLILAYNIIDTTISIIILRFDLCNFYDNK